MDLIIININDIYWIKNFIDRFDRLREKIFVVFEIDKVLICEIMNRFLIYY